MSGPSSSFLSAAKDVFASQTTVVVGATAAPLGFLAEFLYLKGYGINYGDYVDLKDLSVDAIEALAFIGAAGALLFVLLYAPVMIFNRWLRHVLACAVNLTIAALLNAGSLIRFTAEWTRQRAVTTWVKLVAAAGAGSASVRTPEANIRPPNIGLHRDSWVAAKAEIEPESWKALFLAFFILLIATALFARVLAGQMGPLGCVTPAEGVQRLACFAADHGLAPKPQKVNVHNDKLGVLPARGPDSSSSGIFYLGQNSRYVFLSVLGRDGQRPLVLGTGLATALDFGELTQVFEHSPPGRIEQVVQVALSEPLKNALEQHGTRIGTLVSALNNFSADGELRIAWPAELPVRHHLETGDWLTQIDQLARADREERERLSLNQRRFDECLWERRAGRSAWAALRGKVGLPATCHLPMDEDGAYAYGRVADDSARKANDAATGLGAGNVMESPEQQVDPIADGMSLGTNLRDSLSGGNP